jgi:hypothetical protein
VAAIVLAEVLKFGQIPKEAFVVVIDDQYACQNALKAASADDSAGHSEPLWRSDYSNDDNLIELSFRDLIELRFVKAFRDAGLALPTIRESYQRAAEEVHDERPFSTQKFRTDGKTIFLEITEGIQEAKLIDLRGRQNVFRTIVEPSLKDLEFDAAACPTFMVQPSLSERSRPRSYRSLN